MSQLWLVVEDFSAHESGQYFYQHYPEVHLGVKSLLCEAMDTKRINSTEQALRIRVWSQYAHIWISLFNYNEKYFSGVFLESTWKKCTRCYLKLYIYIFFIFPLELSNAWKSLSCSSGFYIAAVFFCYWPEILLFSMLKYFFSKDKGRCCLLLLWAN